MSEPLFISHTVAASLKHKLQLPKPRHCIINSWMNCSSVRLTTTATATAPKCCGKVNNRWSLNGMNALVTGGTRGIGHAIVEELCGLGANVHTCARNEDELGTCLRSWKDEGFAVSGSLCDVSSQVDHQKLMEVVSSTFDGRLNILLAYPLLKESGAGSIVFTSSVSGFVSLKSMSVQGATKGAINQLTKYLACEWAKDNIRSNAVAPWYIKTSMVKQVLSNKVYLQEVYDRTPLGRLGEPSEV